MITYEVNRAELELVEKKLGDMKSKAPQVFKNAVNKTATDALYCRNDAGSNKKALCVIPAGTEVHNYGYYTTYNGVKWLYITVTLDGVEYIGFSSKSYLKK